MATIIRGGPPRVHFTGDIEVDIFRVITVDLVRGSMVGLARGSVTTISQESH